MKKYDVVVIGSGSGGLTAAFTAKGFGKKVLIIDRGLPGGECTWSGCVPSKALINEANKVHTVRSMVDDFVYDTKTVMAKVKKVIDNVYAGESIDVLEKDGIDFIQGHAKFMNSHELSVNGEKIQGKKIFIATGSSPLVLPIPGLENVNYLDNESLFKLDELPESMIILGGGAIGVEMGQAMNRLGVEVHLVELSDHILIREEAVYAKRLQGIMEREGVHIYTGHKAISVNEKDGMIEVKASSAFGEKVIKAKGLLLAIGRKANMDLDLDKAGIAYDQRKIIVNDYMETSAKGVYAIGDVVGPYQFSHMANVQGIQAVQNAVLPFNRKVNYQHVAWTTFSQPELARAGMTEEEAREAHGDSIRVYDFEFNHLDRAMTKGDTEEAVKIVVDRKGRILGASILADRAGELISELQVMKTLGKRLGDFANVIHPYPTYAEVFSKLGKKAKVDQLLNHPIVKLVRRV